MLVLICKAQTPKNSLTPRSISLRKYRKYLRENKLLRNLFYLVVKSPDGLIYEKKANKSRDTANLTFMKFY